MKPERKIQVIRPDPAAIRYLKKRRHRRWILFLIAVSVFASVVVGRLAIVGPVGDDWARVDHQTFQIIGIDRGMISLKDAGTVRMPGICIPADCEAGAAASAAWFSNQIAGNSATLMIVGPKIARIYLDGTDDLALSAVKAGMAYADRRGTDPFRPALTAAEADARKHDRGLWAGLKFDQMPAWRQAWLRERAKPK
jgi:hypothetical protein